MMMASNDSLMCRSPLSVTFRMLVGSDSQVSSGTASGGRSAAA